MFKIFTEFTFSHFNFSIDPHNRKTKTTKNKIPTIATIIKKKCNIELYLQAYCSLYPYRHVSHLKERIVKYCCRKGCCLKFTIIKNSVAKYVAMPMSAYFLFLGLGEGDKEKLNIHFDSDVYHCLNSICAQLGLDFQTYFIGKIRRCRCKNVYHFILRVCYLQVFN